MKHILLIANLSGRDSQLLKYAARFCKNQDLRLHVLEIEENKEAIFLSSPYYFNKMGFIVGQEHKEKRKELETFVSQSTKDLIDSTWVSTKIVKGNVESSLI